MTQYLPCANTLNGVTFNAPPNPLDDWGTLVAWFTTTLTEAAEALGRPLTIEDVKTANAAANDAQHSLWAAEQTLAEAKAAVVAAERAYRQADARAEAIRGLVIPPSDEDDDWDPCCDIAQTDEERDATLQALADGEISEEEARDALVLYRQDAPADYDGSDAPEPDWCMDPRPEIEDADGLVYGPGGLVCEGVKGHDGAHWARAGLDSSRYW